MANKRTHSYKINMQAQKPMHSPANRQHCRNQPYCFWVQLLSPQQFQAPPQMMKSPQIPHPHPKEYDQSTLSPWTSASAVGAFGQQELMGCLRRGEDGRPLDGQQPRCNRTDLDPSQFVGELQVGTIREEV